MPCATAAWPPPAAGHLPQPGVIEHVAQFATLRAGMQSVRCSARCRLKWPPADDLSTSAGEAQVRMQCGDLGKVAVILLLLAITASFLGPANAGLAPIALALVSRGRAPHR